MYIPTQMSFLIEESHSRVQESNRCSTDAKGEADEE